MSKPLRIDREAQEELGAAVSWYEDQRPGLGRELLDAVDETLRRIEAAPQAASPALRLPQELGVRRRLVQRFPYSVFYMELSEEIRILAIAHTRRRPFYWRQRLE